MYINIKLNHINIAWKINTTKTYACLVILLVIISNLGLNPLHLNIKILNALNNSINIGNNLNMYNNC